MNRFEDKVHNGRRKQGELKGDEISNMWFETQHAMFDDSVKLTENYGIWWSYIPHFLHTPGYVYSYAFGELLVLALYALYRNEGEDFVPKYMKLLSAGGSQTPYKLLEPFGVNLNDSGFWRDGLRIIDDMLKMIEA